MCVRILEFLKIKNFKGIKDRAIFLREDSTEIFGMNATGKTTTCDAFYWLLDGKDMSGRAEFTVRPNFATKDTVTSVEAKLGGLVLKRELHEAWQRIRGNPIPKFKGHKSKFFINEEPTNKKEFESRTKEEICDIKIIRILTNITGFSSLGWEKQREIIIDFCGQVSDSDVLGLPEFSELKNNIGDRSLEGGKKIYESQRRKLINEINTIPARINELVNQLCGCKDVSDADIYKLKYQLNQVTKEIAENKPIDQNEIKAAIESKEIFVNTSEVTIASLRREFENLTNETPLDETICSVCGQSLPVKKLEETRDLFKNIKNDRIIEIRKKCEAIRLSINKAKADIKGLEFQIKSSKSNKNNVGTLIEKQASLREKYYSAEGRRIKYKTEQKSRARIKELEEMELEGAKKIAAIEKQLSLIDKAFLRKMQAVESCVNDQFKLVKFKMFHSQINEGVRPTCEILVDDVILGKGLNHGAEIRAGLDIIESLQKFYKVKLPVFIDNFESLTGDVNFDGQLIKLIVRENERMEVR